MPKRYLYWFLSMFVVVLVAGCGGTTSPNDDGGGSSGNPGAGGNSSGSDSPDNGGSIARNVNLIVDSNNLPSDATSSADGVQVSAIVRDANNNLVADRMVSFSADSGALAITRNTTDVSGVATAVLTTGGNPRNRTITITANAGLRSDSVQVEVVGTQLSLTGPTTLVRGDSAPYTASLTDAGGDGIANEPVTVSSARGNMLSMSNPQTTSNGQAQFTVTATNAGTDTLTASALAEQAQIQVRIAADDFQLTAPDDGTRVELNTPETVTLRWLDNGTPVVGKTIQFATTRGSLSNDTVATNANGRASVTVTADNAGPATITATESGGLQTSTSLQFIATNPDSIDVQANPATVSPTGQSDITAIVRDANNNLVTGETVNFSLTDTSGGSLRDARVVTDLDGIARTVYTAGTTSASRPASITATVDSDTSINTSVDVRIGDQALRITLGTGNELMEPNSTTYQLPYVALVTDANGVPVPDADFRLATESLSYQKGRSLYSDTDGNGSADAYAPIYNVPAGTPHADSFGCRNEDINGNGVADAGEDINDNGALDPGNVASVPSTAPLDENGIAEFNVTYPQNHAQWVRVELRAVASVQGTETTADAVFILPVLADDVNDSGVSPPNRVSPFGTSASCTDAN